MPDHSINELKKIIEMFAGNSCSLRLFECDVEFVSDFVLRRSQIKVQMRHFGCSAWKIKYIVYCFQFSLPVNITSHMGNLMWAEQDFISTNCLYAKL